jgi:hypothetical protein
LVASFCKEDKIAINNALNELKKFGYLIEEKNENKG